MPKQAPELSPMAVKRLDKPGLHAVGGVPGLFLRIASGGSRQWILRATVGRKRRDIGLGGYPGVTLAQARENAREAREKIRQGIDPSEERKAARAALMAAQAKALTFDEAARRCHDSKAPEFRNDKHGKDWISSLERYASPVIGDLPVTDVELPHVLEILEPIWQSKTETATRVRQRIESVLTWATVRGYRSGENPARWEGNLKEVLPNPTKVAKVTHHRALPWNEMGQFMADLRQREGMAARALEFLVLTAARSGEVRLATWDEIDLDAGIWTVPAERIKAGRQHRVPLSDDAMAVLKGLPRIEGSSYIFPAARGGPLSDMALSALCKRMGVDATPHGFRSTLKDWARNRTAYPDEVSELALAHVNSDATRAAYARDELLPQRKRLMADWAKFCATIERDGDNVRALREAAE